MKKIRDAIVLFAITLIAGLLLGGVNEITKDAIAEQEAIKLAEAYKAVSPMADSFELTDLVAAELENAESLMAAQTNLGTVIIEDAVEAFDKTFSPKEKKWMPSQEEFYIYSHSSVVR